MLWPGVFGVAGCILFTVVGQIILKWRLGKVDTVNSVSGGVADALLKITDPWVVFGLFSAVIAALCWMIALAYLPISAAYPFMSISFVLVLLCSAYFLGETVNIAQWIGLFVVIVGLLISVSSKVFN